MALVRALAPGAIILAAGVGRRFGDGPGARPKALLEVGGETLVARLVRQLRVAGVERIAIVAGHGARFVEAAFGGDDGVRVLRNLEHRRGAILSLWTARDALCEWTEIDFPGGLERARAIAAGLREAS